MSFLNQLTKSISSTNILALDLSINNTGYCWIECFEKDIEIRKMGLISTFKETEEDKVTEVTSALHDMLRHRNSMKLVVVIEKPPYTLYNKQFSKSAIVARATSLFKLFMLYGAIRQFITDNRFMTVSIYPVEWQRKIKRPGIDVKKLSLALANSRITTCEIKDENIADAVNIAFHVWRYRKKLLRNILPGLVNV